MRSQESSSNSRATAATSTSATSTCSPGVCVAGRVMHNLFLVLIVLVSISVFDSLANQGSLHACRLIDGVGRGSMVWAGHANIIGSGKVWFIMAPPYACMHPHAWAYPCTLVYAHALAGVTMPMHRGPGGSVSVQPPSTLTLYPTPVEPTLLPLIQGHIHPLNVLASKCLTASVHCAFV